MPANPKYLSTSPWQKGSKISAGIIGGYLITSLFHMVLALVLPNGKAIIITSIFSAIILWSTLLIIPFLFKNGWKAWLLYLAIIILLYTLYFFANQQNSFL